MPQNGQFIVSGFGMLANQSSFGGNGAWLRRERRVSVIIETRTTSGPSSST